MRKIAVFASGNGSNFEEIVQATRDGRLAGVEVALLVCDKPEAFVLDRAVRLGIPSFSFRPKDYPDKEAYEKEILQRLQEAQVSFVVLAGYMRLVGATLLSAYERRMINLHPSLLPAFPGKDAIGQAIRHGVKWTGVTVHYVDAGLDTGPIIDQAPVQVLPGDDHVSLAERIHQTERKLLVGVLRTLLLSSS